MNNFGFFRMEVTRSLGEAVVGPHVLLQDNAFSGPVLTGDHHFLEFVDINVGQVAVETPVGGGIESLFMNGFRVANLDYMGSTCGFVAVVPNGVAKVIKLGDVDTVFRLRAAKALDGRVEHLEGAVMLLVEQGEHIFHGDGGRLGGTGGPRAMISR